MNDNFNNIDIQKNAQAGQEVALVEGNKMPSTGKDSNIVMTTEEFHELLEENVSKQSEARSNYQLQLTDLLYRYNKAIDQIADEEKTALDTLRKARADFERAKTEYDDAMRYLKKMRDSASRTYNERKAAQAGIFAMRNNDLQSERHNIFERFRDSGAISRRCKPATSPLLVETRKERSER